MDHTKNQAAAWQQAGFANLMSSTPHKQANPGATYTYGAPSYQNPPSLNPLPNHPVQQMLHYSATPVMASGMQPPPMKPSPNMTPPLVSGSQVVTPGKPSGIQVPGLLPVEESYIENILRLNLGKIATIYMTYENNREWNAKVFRGKIEAAGRDHIIISDPDTGMRTLLLMVNLDYITFDEQLNYIPPALPR